MGWLYSRKPADMSATDYMLSRVGDEWRKSVVATAATIEAVFMVYRHQDPDSRVYLPDEDGFCRAIVIFKINHVPRASDGYTFGYKDMDESMGPYGCEAPLKILAAASPLRPIPANELESSSLRNATLYRERSRQYAAQRALKRSLATGTHIKLSQPVGSGGILRQHFTVVRTRVRGRRGISTCFRAEDGALCHLRPEQLQNLTIEPAAVTERPDQHTPRAQAPA